MELGSYPFSERYGWIQDKYGLSWQLMYVGEQKVSQVITPMLMFVGEQCGKAEEAMRLYTSLFPQSQIGNVMRHESGKGPDKTGTVQYGSFTLAGQAFAAMDSAEKHAFAFNEAVSLIVHCDTQEEIDYYWNALSKDPKAEQCGWLKDAYGVSWQIVPSAMDEMMATADKEKLARVTQAFLKMKKFDLAELQRAYEGKV